MRAAHGLPTEDIRSLGGGIDAHNGRSSATHGSAPPLHDGFGSVTAVTAGVEPRHLGARRAEISRDPVVEDLGIDLPGEREEKFELQREGHVLQEALARARDERARPDCSGQGGERQVGAVVGCEASAKQPW